MQDNPRKRAREAGEKTYHGRPCKLGHTVRRTCNKHCVECDRAEKRVDTASGYWNEYHRWWRSAKDPERVRQRLWEATYRLRHTFQLERKEAERLAVRLNTLRLIYYSR